MFIKTAGFFFIIILALIIIGPLLRDITQFKLEM